MPVNAETTTWTDRIAAAGGTVTAAHVTAVDAFITSGKTNGWWARLLDCGVFVGDQLAAALVKLKAYTGTATSLANTGFVAGDYLTTRGLKGGTGKSLDTGFNFATYATGILGLSFFLNDGIVIGGTAAFIGHTNGLSPYAQIYTGAVGPGGAFNDSFPSIVYGAGTGRGLYHYAQRTTIEFKARCNGVAFYTNTTAFVDAAGANTTCKVVGTDGACPYYGSFYAIDDGQMGDAISLLFATDVRQLQLSLARIVPLPGRQRYMPSSGQSLDGGGPPRLSTTQPYSNIGLNQNTGFYLPGRTNVNFVPYTEGPDYETPSAGAANMASALWRVDHADDTSKDLLLSKFGQGGAGIVLLEEGSVIFEGLIAHLAEIIPLCADWHSGGLCVPFVAFEHGETDFVLADYQARIVAYQLALDTRIKAVTGQTEDVVLLHSQPSSWSVYVPTAISPIAILAAHVANPGKICCVGPKYPLEHTPAPDGVHIPNTSARLIGEYRGKAVDHYNRRYDSNGVENVGWAPYEPLRPTSVTRAGAVITVSFAGRVGDLVLDTTTVTNPGNYGFEWAQTGGTSRTISSVELINDASEVRITLSGDPGTPTTQRLRYAYTGNYPAPGGPTSGPRGNLRDSDTVVGAGSGTTLRNWLVHFDEAVTTTVFPGLEYEAPGNRLQFTAKDGIIQFTASGSRLQFTTRDGALQFTAGGRPLEYTAPEEL